MTAMLHRYLAPEVRRSLAGLGAFAGRDEPEPLPGTARHYEQTMRRQFPGRPVPTLADQMALSFAATTCPDDAARGRMQDTLRSMQTITRTGTETLGGGKSYGYAVAPSMAAQIVDQARTRIGPWSCVKWVPVPSLEYWMAVTFESSRADGSRWGGIRARWEGTQETTLPAASQPALARINFRLSRCMIQSQPLTRDLWADTNRIQDWLDATAQSEIRFAIEHAMLNGTTNAGIGPRGVIGHPAAPVVARQTAGSITQKDIDTLWGSIYAGSARGVVWHCAQSTLTAIDEMASTGGWPEALWWPTGLNPAWPDFATCKGRPVIPCEASPQLGQVGDLVAVDWSQYRLLYRQMNPMDSPLSYSFRARPSELWQGLYGLPDDASEIRISDQILFATDELVVAWKLRAAGDFLWANPSPLLDANGNPVGPAAVLGDAA